MPTPAPTSSRVTEAYPCSANSRVAAARRPSRRRPELGVPSRRDGAELDRRDRRFGGGPGKGGEQCRAVASVTLLLGERRVRDHRHHRPGEQFRLAGVQLGSVSPDRLVQFVDGGAELVDEHVPALGREVARLPVPEQAGPSVGPGDRREPTDGLLDRQVGRAVEDLDRRVVVGRDRLEEEIFLAGEVPVDRGRPHGDGIGDVGHPDLRVALSGEEFGRRSEDERPSVARTGAAGRCARVLNRRHRSQSTRPTCPDHRSLIAETSCS